MCGYYAMAAGAVSHQLSRCIGGLTTFSTFSAEVVNLIGLA